MGVEMNRRVSLLCALGAAVALGTTFLPASASHGADDHTSNLTYQGTSVPSTQTYTNSDLAFWGNRAYAGNYGGFRIIDITNPSDIENPANVISDFVCPGAQFDISVWNNDGDPAADLLFASVDAPLEDDTCDPTSLGADGVDDSPTGNGSTASDPDSWEGVRIFDINVETAPVQIAAVPTDCGSHTNTVVPDPVNSTLLYVYVSSYPLGAGALTNDIPADTTTTPQRAAGTKNDGTECREPEGANTKVHNKISIIKVNLPAPATADDRTPHVSGTGWTYTNVKEVALDGQTRPTHRTIGDRLFEFTGCHDIAVFTSINRAAAACWEEGQFWDISDPFNPTFLRRMRSEGFVDTLFHSATWTWDGKLVAFEDEAGGGGAARCRLEDGEPDQQGRMMFYRKNGELAGTFKIRRDIVGPCTAHNYNVLPLNNGKYILSSAWYYGGTSMIDFTNPAAAKEVGYYVHHTTPNANTANPNADSDIWSSYWYNGSIFANGGLVRGHGETALTLEDFERGLDVFSFSHPALSGAQTLPSLNPQTQRDLIAQTYTFASSVSIRHTRRPHVFKGTAGSAKASCKPGRTVRVFKVRTGPDRRVGTATTNSVGAWTVRHTLGGAGRYYAVAASRSIPDGINTVVCASDASPKIRVAR